MIRPLVDVYGLEDSLAALLDSRSTDLSYEKVRSCPVNVLLLLLFWLWV